MFKKILVPLDGSTFSERALPYAVEMARHFDGEILLLQVVQPAPVIYPAVAGQTVPTAVNTQLVMEAAQEQNKANINQAKRYLSNRVRQIAKRGIRCSYYAVLGEAAETIIQFSRKKHISLVVMTTRGKSGIKRALLGSVADKVIREPGIHVLAIRPENRIKKS